jgi:integrase
MEEKLEGFANELKAEGMNKITVDKYVWAVKRFLRFSNGETNKQKAVDFFTSEREQGKKPSHLRFFNYALKRWFNFLGLDWDLSPPKVNTYEQFTPTMSKSEVEKLIKQAKKICNDEELAKLAVSTTYGLRREEIRLIDRKDINEFSHTIRIKTRKGGDYRIHIIPEEIQRYVYWYEWDKIVSDNQTSLIFRQMFMKCGVYKSGYGPHTIRRSLITELTVSGVQSDLIRDFMRWKSRFQDILERYQRLEKRRPEIDRMIFEHHPYLPFWRE